MKLTKMECEIPQHRLDVPDAIEDCFLDTEEFSFTEEDIYNGIVEVQKCIDNKELHDKLSPCGKEVLADCVDGCTWMSCNYDAMKDGEITKAKFNYCYMHYENLATKVSNIIGRRVQTRL